MAICALNNGAEEYNFGDGYSRMQAWVTAQAQCCTGCDNYRELNACKKLRTTCDHIKNGEAISNDYGDAVRGD
jgi:hypothetical protein